MAEPSALEPLAPNAPPAGVGADAPKRRRRLPSIRVLVTLLVVFPVAIVSIALGVIATVTSRSVAEQLGREIVADAAMRVSADVRDYLSGAVRVSNLYDRRLRDGTLKSNDLPAWERTMFHDLAANPDVASICFSDPQGNCTWLLHAHQRLELGLVNGKDRDHAIEFPADAAGNVDRSHPIRIYHYDATARPWYQVATATDDPRWTPIYFWFANQGPASETGSGYTRIVRDADGRDIGVLVIDVTLGALSDHLRQLPIASSGYAFIVDDKGLVVAASEGAVNSDAGDRLAPINSNSQAISAAGRFVGKLIAQPTAAAREDSDRVFIGDAPARVFAAPLAPFPGIRWHVITVLPEASFLSGTNSLQRRSTLLAAGAIAGGIALGLLLARRLSRPLLKITGHVGRIGLGDLDVRLELSDTWELRRLADELNRMSAGLQHRLALERSLEVASQVQHSLLPAEVPSICGLEIVGLSRYCESTGGDYYDLIRVDHGNKAELLVAVGDVTGHGIGAALLMATARGAVRASCGSRCALDEILVHVNRVLVSSEKRGMFMTLTLVAIDPSTQMARWSTAGHDPTLVYFPERDAFDELGGADLPLGIEEPVDYRELSRPCATPGAIFVVGTDGIWEARNRQREMFGKERLREVIREHSCSAKELSSQLELALQHFLDGAALQDDVTFVIVKVNSAGSLERSAATVR